MSIDAIKWRLVAVIIALGFPLGWLIGDLPIRQMLSVITVVYLMGVSFYLMGSL